MDIPRICADFDRLTRIYKLTEEEALYWTARWNNCTEADAKQVVKPEARKMIPDQEIKLT